MTTKPRFTRRAVLAGAGATVASPNIWTSAQAQAGGAIKIGMPLGLDRPLGSVGQQQKRGAEFYAKLQNAKGGILGRKIELADRGHGRQPGDLRAQGAGDGRAPGLPAFHRHHAVVRGARHRAQARRVGRHLHLVGQRRWAPDRRELRAEFLPRQHLRPHGRARGLALSSRKPSSRASMPWAWTTLGATTASRCSRTR